MYLLLAGIYLHDIGMQCDVANFPEIEEKANEFGAKFDVEFTAENANAYSIEEQNCIRRNHQYLTAAWIDHAYLTGNTALGRVTIPEHLVADLIDVCEYHSQLPINDCPTVFRSDPNGRKQLVAALLRFADELDIDRNRVSIETIKNFRLDPKNAVYWWLHNRANVIFSASNVIDLKVRLHPNDKKKYGTFIHTAFITEFQTKNRPVLMILRQNDIPIVINSESEVVDDNYAEPLPLNVVQSMRTIQEEHNSNILDDKKSDVNASLKVKRYVIQDGAFWNNKGQDYYKIGNYEEAIKCYDVALEMNNGDPFVWNNKGSALRKLGRHSEAIKCYDQAINRFPTIPFFLNNKGQTLHEIGLYQEAVECYNKAINRVPEIPEFWKNKGLALQALHLDAEAKEAFDRAKSLSDYRLEP